MPRLNFGNLPLPGPKEQAVVLSLVRGFESEEKARNEDKVRAKLLRKAASLAYLPENRLAASSLAHVLEYNDDYPPETIASSLRMRLYRISAIHAFFRLFEVQYDVDWVTFHLTPRGLDIPGAQLQDFDPRRACRALRATFDRIGVSAAEGALFCYLDGEYEPNTDVFRIHFHGFATGDKVQALEGLRNLRNFRSERFRSRPGRSIQRVRILRKLTNFPYHLSYLLKSFWPSRWEGDIEGKMVRQRFRSRIREPRHSQLLLWFNRWRLGDLVILVGLEVGSDGLRLTQKIDE